MKYSLTIHDLSAAQVTDLMSRVENAEISTVRPDNVIKIHNTAPTPVSETAIQNNEAAQVQPADVAAIMNASTEQLLKAGKTGELDSVGFPWDERIHSGSKKKNADGKWKLRKGVDAELVKQVEAELKTAPQTPNSDFKDIPAFLQNQPAPNANVSAPATVPATSVAPVTAPVAAPVAAPAAIMAQPAPIMRDFSGLMLKISNLFATKQITPDYPNTIVSRINQGFGVAIATLTDIQHDPRMVEYGWQCLEVDGKAA